MGSNKVVTLERGWGEEDATYQRISSREDEVEAAVVVLDDYLEDTVAAVELQNETCVTD